MRLWCSPDRRSLVGGTAALIAFAAAALVSPAGCGDDTTPVDSSTAPTGSPSVTIQSPAKGECISIGSDPNALILLHLSAVDLILRPPGLCGSSTNCGNVVVRVNGKKNNVGSAAALDVLLHAVDDRYGELTITVEVVNDDGEILINTSADAEAGIPVTASVTVTTKESCSEGAGGAGAGGAGAGGAGGAGAGAGGGSGKGGGGAGGVGG